VNDASGTQISPSTVVEPVMTVVARHEKCSEASVAGVVAGGVVGGLVVGGVIGGIVTIVVDARPVVGVGVAPTGGEVIVAPAVEPVADAPVVSTGELSHAPTISAATTANPAASNAARRPLRSEPDRRLLSLLVLPCRDTVSRC
jgi:hypothetical protein